MIKLLGNTANIWPQQWQQLAVMLDSGLSIEVALKTLLGTFKEVDADLARVIALVQRGVGLSDAFLQTNIVNRTDFTVIHIAEKAGKLPLGLQEIAKRRSKWHQRIQSLKGALLLPKLILLLGAFAGLLVRTLSANQDVWSALQSVSLTLLTFWFIITLSVWVLQRDLLVWLSIGWRLPSFSRSNKVYKLAFEHTFYRLLTWQITSGIAADLAFNNMQYLLNANTYQRSVRSIAVAANSGMNLVQCLTEHGFVLTQQMKRVMQTSLHAGAWEQGVSHHLRLQSQQLDRKADDFFKWLPKFYYLLALLAVTQFMFV